jgi:hypothetical protein
MKTFLVCLTASMFLSTAGFSAERSTERARLDEIEQSLKADVPRILCLDDSFATGGQPTEQAYAKAAANGFRSVLSLRAGNESVDLFRERLIVE